MLLPKYVILPCLGVTSFCSFLGGSSIRLQPTIVNDFYEKYVGRRRLGKEVPFVRLDNDI